MSTIRDAAEKFFGSVQDAVCDALEPIDGGARFHEDRWTHEQGGGGRTRVLRDGAVFERAGVNLSAVEGALPEKLRTAMHVGPADYFATGISLVLHPASPMVPTVHANFRYFELSTGDAWFGGGTDLTPSYLFEEDAAHFHGTLKSACDLHSAEYYPRFKKWCDEYFLIAHRGERRGIGGIFFDYLRGAPVDLERIFDFVRTCGDAFLPSYLPIVARRRHAPYGERERRWQLLRRGRYAEFNLVYDRGTLFGLETRGRTESILMSLPPLAAWEYDHHPEPGSAEAILTEALKTPREWV